MSTVLTPLPAWALPEELVARWTLPFATPSQGALSKMRADEYKRLREQTHLHLRSAVAPLPRPVPRAGLVIVRSGQRWLNWDNAYGGLKPLLDCLVPRSTAHPAGLGYLADDSPSSGLPYPPHLVQLLAVNSPENTIVELYRIR